MNKFFKQFSDLDFKKHQTIVNNNLKNIKKDFGMFFTPQSVIDFMVNLIDSSRYLEKEDITILEPACGLTQFLVGIMRNHPELYRKSRLFGVEINKDVVSYLHTLKLASNIKIINADYLLWETDLLFDIIIGNPPYGIPSFSEHYAIKVSPDTKQKYKNIYETWYGKYNVYGAFIEKSIKLLKPGGQLIFIIPATFMILDEFKKLRAFLSRSGKTNIIYLGSDVFKPEADVASVVLDFHLADQPVSYIKLFERSGDKIKLIKESYWQGEVIKFETDYSRFIDNNSSYRVGDVYNITISPRTSEIKKNPLIKKTMLFDDNEYIPLLDSRNLMCNKIIYENKTGYVIKKTNMSKLRRYFNFPHIVVGLGFREDGKIGAAIDTKCYPWMGDVYHLIRKKRLFNNAFDMTDKEVVKYLSSVYVKKYIKDVYREITYHLSITQLKNLPLPTKKEWNKIKQEVGYD